MYNFDTLIVNIRNTWFFTIIGIVFLIYALVELIRNKLESKEKREMQFFLAGACIWIIFSTYSALSYTNSFNNIEIDQFTGSFHEVLNRNSEPEYHFKDKNGKSYVVSVTDPAMKEMNNDEELKKDKTYTIHYEKGSMTIVAIEEVE